MGKSKENSKIPTLEKEIKFRKNIFGSYSDTKIGPWFRFPIPKPGFRFIQFHFACNFVRKLYRDAAWFSNPGGLAVVCWP